MEYLKVSDFLKSKTEMPFLLGAFYGRYCFTDDNALIYIYPHTRHHLAYQMKPFTNKARLTICKN
ncbi:hypothetical protein [Helicobacter acinonychis]|uniref:hypothetical protein n=1 Tax=Helicobacter acinonychis TaxID=212 RepID=UPI001F25B0E2|nr:hypothetical protein [Helicobacter acinonychis]